MDEGERADLEYQNMQQIKKAEEEARRAEEEARVAEEQEDIRRKAWEEEGRTDVQFNRDSSKWKYSDEPWDEGRNV